MLSSHSVMIIVVPYKKITYLMQGYSWSFPFAAIANIDIF